MNRIRSFASLVVLLWFCVGASGFAASKPLAPNLNAPAIDGKLLNLSGLVDLSKYKTVLAVASLTTKNRAPALKVVFAGTGNYPNIQFPVPSGGWNLSAFGGVQVDLSNPGPSAVKAALRVDNAGDWRQSPWNTQSISLAPGESKTLRVTFGQSEGAPGYALDTAHIMAMQVFLVQPKQTATLLINNLRTSGSPQDRAALGGFSSPSERTTPITPPKWLGNRPPTKGNWVQTLNENFEGKAINDKLWSDRTWWNGLIADQTQRYSRDNLIIGDGVLKIKTEKCTGPEYDDPSLPSRDYTSGLLLSYDKWSQLYGYFEARIKLPTARGLWPAFWMMPDRGSTAGKDGWTRENTLNGGMEIDILEHLTEWGPGRANVAAHWDGYDTGHKQWGTTNIYYGPTPSDWHNFGVLWGPGKLTWYIDGVKKAEFASDRVGSIPAYPIFNVQMGGWATKDVDEAKLPDFMQVDYVRAWQLKERLKR